jgi:hypothetical protein
MKRQKMGTIFLTVFLVATLFAVYAPTANAVNIGGNNQYYLWGGFTDEDGNHITSIRGYDHNGTICIPYINGSTQIGGAVNVDSHYMDYTFYGNITYADGTLFQGTYTVYLGQQSNDISYAIDFSSTYIWDNGAIDLVDTYYSGYSGVHDTNVFTWFSNLPPFSTLEGTTYLGVKYNFVNASAGVNYNVVYLFVIDGYLGQDAFSNVPTPTSIVWGGAAAPTTWQGFTVYGIGLLLTFISLVLLMKVTAAWMPALFLLAIGLVVTMSAWTSLFGLVGWAMVILISPVFLYSGNKGPVK